MTPIDFVKFSEPCVVRMAYLEDYDHYPFSQCSAKRFTKPYVTSPTSEHYWINFLDAITPTCVRPSSDSVKQNFEKNTPNGS